MADWNPKANEIFLKALEIASTDERRAYLKQACDGDRALRRRVVALLKAHDDAGSFLDAPALEPEGTELVPGNGEELERGPDENVLDPTMVEPPAGEAGSVTGGDIGGEQISLDFLEPIGDAEPQGASLAGGSRPLGRFGPYLITEVVGRGGMGVVLKGQDPKLNRVVAIKVLAPELASNATARKRFLREARAAAAVSHDHVVTIHAIEESAGLPYIVMEYVSGWSLQQRIDRSGPLELNEILRISRQTALGLAAAHAEGLIHRDVKPANILLENGVERVKLSDFGLARAVDDVGTTQTGVVAGTPQYMSPEQAQGLHVDHRSDLFSLGCVMYAMCTGRSPFRADSTIAVIRRVCDDAPRPISHVNPDVPDWLVQIIESLLAKQPEARFQSAAEVAELVGHYLAHLQRPGQISPPDLEPVDRSFADSSAADETVERLPASGISSVLERIVSRNQGGSIAVALAVLLLVALVVTEATGVTDVGGMLATVLRVQTPEGTLIVQVDDPNVSVTIDGEDVVISGAGVNEVRLKPGTYRLTATNNGRLIKRQIVQITRGGKQVVRIDLERPPTGRGAAKLGSVDPVAVFNEFQAYPTAVVFAPDGEALITGDANGRLKFWNLNTLRDAGTIAAHKSQVWSLEHSPDGKLLASAGRDGTLKLWKTEGNLFELQASVEGHEGNVWSAAFSPDGEFVVTVSGDKTARVWTVKDGASRAVLESDYPVTAVGFSPDGKSLATANEAGYVTLWDSGSWRQRQRIHAHLSIPRLAFSRDGKKLVTAGTDKLIKVWRLADLDAPTTVLRGPEEWIEDIEFSPDGKLLVSVGGDWDYPDKKRPDKIRLWDIDAGRQLAAFDGHESLVRQAAFSPDGRLFATCSRDGTVKLWDVDELLQNRSSPTAKGAVTELRRFAGQEGVHYHAAFDRQSQRILTTGIDDDAARLWNVADGRQLREFPGRFGRAAFTPDGIRVLTGTHHAEQQRINELTIWDAESGNKVRTLEASTGVFVDIAVSPDGRLAASAHAQWWGDFSQRDNTVRIWDLESSQVVREIRDHSDQVESVSFTPDGTTIVSASRDGTVRLWNVETGAEIRQFEGTGTAAFAAAVSPDGRFVLAGFGPHEQEGLSDYGIDDPTHCIAILWELETGQEIRRFVGHYGAIRDVAFSPNGKLIVTASGGAYVGAVRPGDTNYRTSSDKTVRIWNSETGQQLTVLSHRTTLNSAEFSPDGRYLVSGESQMFRVWSAPQTRDARATASATGMRQLLVSSNRGGDFDIYLVNEDGAGWQNLTNHPAEDSGPAFSPDGERIAFCSDRSGNLDVWVMNADGSDPRRLTTYSGIDRTPCWSPDGKRIAIVRHLTGDNWEVFAMNADGSNQVNLSNHPNREADPAWSPDGTKIAFDFHAEGGARLYVMDPDGSNQRMLSPRLGSFIYPAWSPDGRSIVYTAWVPKVGEDLELFVAKADGSNERQLTRLGGLNTFAAWSPDGKKIAFQHRNPNKPGTKAIVFVMNADGTGLEAITGNEAHIGYGGGRPAWRPLAADKARTRGGKITEVRRYEGHTDYVSSLSFGDSPGAFLSGASDGTVRLWDTATGEATLVLGGHSDATKVVAALRPDGGQIASSDATGTLRLWDPKTGRATATIDAHQAIVLDIAFSPDGRWLVTGGMDETARVWDARSGKRLGEFATHNGWITGIAVSPDGRRVATSSHDYTVRIWDSKTFDQTQRLSHPDLVMETAFSPDGRKIATAGRDGVVRVFGTDSGNLLLKLEGHTDRVRDVAFSPNGRLLASGAWDRTLRIWDAVTGRPLAVARDENQVFFTLAFSPDGRHIVSGGGVWKSNQEIDEWVRDGDYALRLWRLPESVWLAEATKETPIEEITLVHEFPRRNSVVHDVAITPDGRHALSGGWNDFVALWDVAAGSFVEAIETDGSIVECAISPDGRRAVANGTYNKLYFLDLRERRIVHEVEAHKGMLRGLTMSPDGQRVLTGGSDQTAAVWDTLAGEELKRFELPFPCYVAAFVPDGRRVVLGGAGGYCQLWDLENDRRVRDFHGHVGNVFSAVASADGRHLLTGCEVKDPTVRLWDLQTAQIIRTFRGHEGNVWSVDFLPDGKHIVSGCDDGTMRVWSLASGREAARATWPNAALNQLAVTPDGRHVLSGGGLHKEHDEQSGQPTGDYSLRLWRLPQSVWPGQNVPKGRRFQTNHLEPTTSVAVSPDGRYLLSCSYDKTVRLSDIATGKEVHGFLGHTKATASAAFSPDGKQAVSGGSDGMLRLWNVETGDLLQELRGHTGWVRTVAFSPDGKFLISGSADYRPEKDQRDRSLRLWDAETGEEIRRFEEIDNAVNAAVFTPDGRHVVAAGEWKMVGLWDVETGEQVRRFATPETHAISLAISPDGRTAATGHVADPPAEGQYFDPENSVVCLWDVETGRLIRKLRGHTASVNAVAFSPDGRFVLSGSGGHHHADTYSAARDNTLRLWEVETGEELWRAETGTCINSVAFTLDGRSVVSGGGELALGGGDNEPDIRLWRLPRRVWARAELPDTAAVISNPSQ